MFFAAPQGQATDKVPALGIVLHIPNFFTGPPFYISISNKCVSQIEEVDKNMKYWQNQSVVTIWCSNNAISEDTEEIVEILSTASFSCADPLFALKIKLFKALK